MSAPTVAMRDAFGEALLALAPDFPAMVVLDADVSTSTRTARSIVERKDSQSRRAACSESVGRSAVPMAVPISVSGTCIVWRNQTASLGAFRRSSLTDRPPWAIARRASPVEA